MRTGAKIKLARERASISQAELAARVGLPLRTLTNIEQGVTGEPKLVDVAAIAAVLGGTCADYLPDDTPEPGPAPKGRRPKGTAPADPVEPPAGE